MLRSLLRIGTFFSVPVAIASIVMLLVSLETAMHVTHAATRTSGAVYVRSTHGRVYVVTRTDPGMGKWPGFSGWEYQSGRDAGRVFLAPGVREPEWRGWGFDSGDATIRPRPRQVHFVAVPWWSVTAGSLVFPVLAGVVAARRRATVNQRCPVCDAQTDAIPDVVCAGCGTRQREGEIPLGASAEVPAGVETTPATRDGASFATARVVIGYDTARVRATSGGQAFGLVFAAAGAGAVALGWNLIRQHTIMSFAAIIPIGAGLMFLLIGVLVVVFPRRAVIDPTAGTIRVRDSARKETHVLGDATAIQVLVKSSGYTCYELNVALKDGRRVNLLSHGNGRRLRRDAVALGAFLNLPVFDHTGERLAPRSGGVGYRLIGAVGAGPVQQAAGGGVRAFEFSD